MGYIIETQYLEHDGGTKFYETVLITETNTAGELDGPSILLKRFGKLASKVGGGQVQIVRGNFTATDRARAKVLNEKRAGKPGKGCYRSAQRPDFGAHKFDEATVSARSLHLIAEKHYDTRNAEDIQRYFGITHEGRVDPEGFVLDDAIEPEEEPAPRDATWGSW